MQATQTALAFPATDASRYPSDADLRGYDRAQSFAKMITAAVAARMEGEKEVEWGAVVEAARGSLT